MTASTVEPFVSTETVYHEVCGSIARSVLGGTEMCPADGLMRDQLSKSPNAIGRFIDISVKVTFPFERQVYPIRLGSCQ
jgi:hypothetical protein